ncbi:MAG: M28 family peptidase [Planctomycetota bacterium]
MTQRRVSSAESSRSSDDQPSPSVSAHLRDALPPADEPASAEVSHRRSTSTLLMNASAPGRTRLITLGGIAAAALIAIPLMLPGERPLSVDTATTASASQSATMTDEAEAEATGGSATMTEADRDAKREVINRKPIASAFAEVSEDVREFDEHLVFLASRYTDGRLPGTEGAELATKYVEHYFEEIGLLPPYGPRTGMGHHQGESDAEADHPDAGHAAPIKGIPSGTSYRQYFPLSYSTEIQGERVAFVGTDGTSSIDFTPGQDFHATTYGEGGEVSGRAVFVGYSMTEGPDGYRSYPDDADLTGKVAVMLRFEPMDEQGRSLWAEEGTQWTGRSSFMSKIKSAVAHNAEAVIIMNTPGADDPRNNELFTGGDGNAMSFPIPVFNMTIEAAERLISRIDSEGRSLMELRRHADEGGDLIEFDGGQIIAEAEIESVPFEAINVGGMIPGRGDLADELIVIGAHRDHLGMGNFGSRWGAGQLHPGADDNASGTAGLILLARMLKKSYEEMPEGASARTLLFVAFDAEESGLHGARWHTRNPIVPLEQHALMVNFDMIGRIENSRLSVSGVDTAQGMEEWLQPHFERTPLEIVQQKGRGFGGSDHLPFYQVEVPILFAIIADFHNEYHTPADVAWKINRVGAVETVYLFHGIIMEATQRAESFVFQAGGDGEQRARQRPSRPRVRMGVVLGNSEPDVSGALLEAVSEGWSAAEAGLQSGDIVTSWNGDTIENAGDIRRKLREGEPGQEVELVVVRDGREIEVTMTLRER